MQIEDILKKALVLYEIEHGSIEINRTMEYLDYLYEHNKQISLVGTKGKKEILIRHIIDSLSMVEVLRKMSKGMKILDIGTGAGFPGIPLSIFFTNNDYFLLESKRKAIDFLTETIKKLKLGNIKIINGRAEEIVNKVEYRQVFDLVTSRALARLDITWNWHYLFV